MVGGPGVRGFNRRFIWHPADVEFRDALDCWPSRLASGFLLNCTAGTDSVAGGAGAVIFEIDGAWACGTCSCSGGRFACNTSATLVHQSSFICSGAKEGVPAYPEASENVKKLVEKSMENGKILKLFIKF